MDAAEATQRPLDGQGALVLSKQCYREVWLDATLMAAAQPRWAKPRAAAVNYRICWLAWGPIPGQSLER